MEKATRDGFIPPSLGQLKVLQYLSLGDNYLSGMIPHSIYNLSAMVGMYFYGNQLDGNLPSNFCDAFWNLQELTVNENQLNGEIPISISNCSSMIKIDLASNNFRGTIPDSIGTLQNLSWLAMGANQIKATDDNWRFFDSLINCTFLQVSDKPFKPKQERREPLLRSQRHVHREHRRPDTIPVLMNVLQNHQRFADASIVVDKYRNFLVDWIMFEKKVGLVEKILLKIQVLLTVNKT
ncbi:putative LRR receptor-like serine/threonine-protein kinase [Carex littledalei]|uniref:Putative LRR receptor-like serine/threonine-protein kinase n=1 Tax=Carex littledalei TaxID=544730 RepID=A0A833RFC5_9POAL|nr:putative LRR receptor-like serine/threonine-protein kinase [Carex littledalei]